VLLELRKNIMLKSLVVLGNMYVQDSRMLTYNTAVQEYGLW